MSRHDVRRFEVDGVAYAAERFQGGRLTGDHLRVLRLGASSPVMTRRVAAGSDPTWISGYAAENEAHRRAVAAKVAELYDR